VSMLGGGGALPATHTGATHTHDSDLSMLGSGGALPATHTGATHTHDSDLSMLGGGGALPAHGRDQNGWETGPIRSRHDPHRGDPHTPPGPGPPSGASLGGPNLGQIGWGGPSTGPTPFFIVVVSPCRCEPLWAGCCGGEGVLGISLG